MERVDRPPLHPGKTPAQRRALDAIGCGDYSPYMAPATRKALLDEGLIVKCGEKVIGRDRFAAIVDEFEMPVPVHMAWCAAVSHGVTDADLDAAVGGQDA